MTNAPGRPLLVGVLPFDFGFEFGERRGDTQERAGVRVALVGIKIDPRVEDVRYNTVLVDEPFDGRREIAHRPLET